MTRFGRLVFPLARVAALGATALGGSVLGGCGHPHATPPAPAAAPPTKPDHERAAETGLPIASTPHGLMQDGAEARIQERLKALHLLPSASPSGKLDPPTREALRRFQKSKGLPTTGLPSYETVEQLGLDLDVIFHTVDRPREPPARPRRPTTRAVD